VVGVVRRETGGDELRNFAGLSARSPLLAACMSIFMLSLAGLPPLAGFFGKFYLFSAALGSENNSNAGLLWLVVVALFGTLVSLYYYLMILKAVFVDEHQPSTSPAEIPVLQQFVVAVLALLVLYFGIMPQALAGPILGSLP
jgi:NADH-quinone oxidoreductase subunit N